jgi:hypothetical protein
MIWTPRTPTDELVVEAVFFWRGSAAGERVLPRIEPRNVNVTRRWLAVDPHGNSPSALVAIAPEDKVDVAEFAALWNAEDWPYAAQRVVQPGPVSLETSDIDSSVSYEAQTNCELTARVTAFAFRAEIKEATSPLALLRLAMPGGAKILSTELGIAGQFRAVPWLPLAGNQIALLPAEAVRNGNILIVRGELPGGPGDHSLIPPTILGGEEMSHAVGLHRRDDVRAILTGHEGFTPTTLESESTSTIPVARFELAQPRSAERVLQWTVEENQPRIVGILVTTLRPQGPEWIARLDAFLAVRDGIVDTFRLETAGGWASPRLVEGDARLQIKELTGGIRHFDIKPHIAASNRYHFACEGTVPLARVQAPSFRLLNAENVQQYIRLHRGDDHEWSTSGMQEAVLPVAATLPGDDNFAVYRAAVSQFHAELLANQPTASLSRVAWGNVNVSVSADGSFVAVADVAVDPSQASALPVVLPADTLLVQALVEGEAAIAELTSQRRLEVPLRSSTLPQLVRIMYSGEHFEGRELNSLALQFDSWKLEQPLTIARGGNARSRMSVTQIVQLLSPALAETANGELDAWANHWLSRLRQAEGHKDGSSAAESPRAREVREQLEALTEPGVIADAPLETETFHEPPVATQAAPVAPWLTALAAWLGVVAAGYRASQSARLREVGRRWPSACAALVAIVVAVLLSPWIGGVLMVVAAASALSWPWQRLAR